jgi:deazaflavin-dependent oxidoreductase (nitroreductase family)
VASPNAACAILHCVQADDKGWPQRWATAPFMYLTTIGRRSGRPHRIEIWFAAHDGRLYLRAGCRDRSDWVRNLRANPRVTVELAGQTRVGHGRVLEEGTAEDHLSCDLLVSKYADDEDDLEEWGRISLPVAIEFPSS